MVFGKQLRQLIRIWISVVVPQHAYIRARQLARDRETIGVIRPNKANGKEFVVHNVALVGVGDTSLLSQNASQLALGQFPCRVRTR